MIQKPSAASGIPSTGSASSMQIVSPAVVNAQNIGSLLQVDNPWAFFSGNPTRPPRIITISSSTGNPQIGTEIRAPAQHLKPFRSSSSISPSSLRLPSGGMSSLQAHNNHAAASMSLRLSYVNPLVHRQVSTTGQSGSTQHEIARGLTNPPGAGANPPGLLMPDSSSRTDTRFHQESHVPSSGSNLAQQSEGATDIICLSDGD
ncbi:uncharacterized protein LOC120148270 [Hibiscus syriacus]|uniref:uncharacterized protein LOC120148270 n=1 Tax=Hibiscus syriacus TaxID=106335 RepID=UPI0019218ACD|nr:uncharacterized protein LOC120148270 [Hibiscus syriacus]